MIDTLREKCPNRSRNNFVFGCFSRSDISTIFMNKSFQMSELLLILQQTKVNFFVYDYLNRSSRPDVFYKKGVLRNFTKFTRKRLCQSLFFSKAAGLTPATLFKKETQVQGFSCEFCEISQNTFLHRTPLVAASVSSKHSI